MPPSSSSSSPPFLDSPPSCKDPELHHYQTMFLSSWNNTSANPSSSTLVPLKRFLHIENAMPESNISPIFSSASSDPLYRCDICDVTATSEDHLNTHMQGGKHKRRVIIAETDAKLKLRNESVLEYVDVGEWKCKACNLEMCCLSIETHLEGEKHRKKLKLWLASNININTTSPSPSPAVRDISVLRRQSRPCPPGQPAQQQQQRTRPQPISQSLQQSQPQAQEKRHPTYLAAVFLANSNNIHNHNKNNPSSAAQVQVQHASGRVGLNANAKEFLPSSPTGGPTGTLPIPPTIIVGSDTQKSLPNFTAFAPTPTPTKFSPAASRQFPISTAPPPNHAERMHPRPAPTDNPLPIVSSAHPANPAILAMGPIYTIDIVPRANHHNKETSRLTTEKLPLPPPSPVPAGNQFSVPFASFGLGVSRPPAAPRVPSPTPRVKNVPNTPVCASPSPQPEPQPESSAIARKAPSAAAGPAHSTAPWNAVTDSTPAASIPIVLHTQEPPETTAPWNATRASTPTASIPVVPQAQEPQVTTAPWNAILDSPTIPVTPHVHEPPTSMVVDHVPMPQFTTKGITANREPLFSVPMPQFPSNVNVANRPLLSVLVPAGSTLSGDTYGQPRIVHDPRVQSLKEASKETQTSAGGSGSPPLKKKKSSDSPKQSAPSTTALPPVPNLPRNSSRVMATAPTELIAPGNEDFSCKTCSVVCNGTEPLKEHLNSKAHARKVDAAKAAESAASGENKGVPRHCGLCNVCVSGEANYIEHIRGKAHSRKLTQKVKADQILAGAANGAAQGQGASLPPGAHPTST